MNHHLESIRRHYLLLLLCCLSIAYLNCKGDHDTGIVGGPCSYTDTPGTATVISINNADPGLSNCKNNPVEVIFNFASDDPTKANDRTDNNQHIVVGAGANPPRDYAINKGLTVGSVHQCIRQDETHGTCTPLGFTFPGIDFSDYGTACF